MHGNVDAKPPQSAHVVRDERLRGARKRHQDVPHPHADTRAAYLPNGYMLRSARNAFEMSAVSVERIIEDDVIRVLTDSEGVSDRALKRCAPATQRSENRRDVL